VSGEETGAEPGMIPN